jgi:hypothetical protein
VHLALIVLVRDKHVRPGTPWPRLVPSAVARGGLLLAVPLGLGHGLTTVAALHLGVGLAAITGAVCAFCAWQPRLASYPLDLPRWLRQAVCVTMASALSLGGALLMARG